MNIHHERQPFLSESEQKRTSFVSEIVSFLLHNKKWWLLPIVIVLLLFGLLLLLGGTAAGPFIYPLF